ncbi:DNA-3-methyladenine glycosylase 2 family protein [Candidatus Parcubacteria bacterium]|nr:DNA-3-methyladenine glycosylase 2 family protein [Candidatus Parcubacteria bacterium]
MNELDKALQHFKKVDPILHKTALKHKMKISRPAEIRGQTRLFSALAESVVSQQLSLKAGATIWMRLKKICGGKVTPESVMKTSLPRLQKAGLSSAKVRTLKELAKATRDGLHLPALKKRTPEEATEELTKIWGIGPWTCEMFLLFALNHPDIFSARDLGLVRSMETLYGLKRNLPLSKLEAIAACWSPYRSLACRILWKARDSKGS